jgi:GMP synthase-like glutamine amidotransferase
MILLVSTCGEKLHELEFVKPVADIVKNILKDKKENIATKHYSKITESDIENSSKIIICGTSLKDNDFLKDTDKFRWIRDLKKPVLGICSGAHLIGLVLGHKVKRRKGIGLRELDMKNEFLGVAGKRLVYHLHNLQVLPEIYKKGDIYATLFHPEVRNREIIENFVRL